MQGTVYKRVKHQCKTGKPRWVRLPNPTPKSVSCPTCGETLTKEKETRYDCSWWAGGKKRSKTFSKKHDASRFLASVVTETHNGTYQQTRAVSMSVVFDEWEKNLDVRLQQGRIKPSTRKTYRSIVKKNLQPAFGACRSDRLTENVVQEWERRCAAALAAGTLSAKYFNNLLATLRVVFSWARGRGQRYLTHDPTSELRPVPVARVERRFLEPEELTALLDAADNTRDRTILYLFAYSGLRRGELFALQWRDIDETTNRLHVRRGLSARIITRPKTEHSEAVIDIPQFVVELLLEYRKQFPSIGTEGFIFRADGTGAHLDPDYWSKRVFVPTATRAGLRAVAGEHEEGQAVGIHSLRHTYGSLLINGNENIKYVSRQLRHANIKITLDVYSHIFKETSEGAMERLDQRIRKQTGTPDIHLTEPKRA